MESVGGGLYVPIMVEHMFESEGIPGGLAEMAPGPRLAAILASIDRDRISGYERVVLLRARARQIAHDQAEFYADIDSIHEAEGKVVPGEWTSDVTEMVASEIRAALTLTRRSADFHLGLASDLIRHLPQVGQALREGRIDLAKARVIVEETSHLESANAQRVADAALERAASQTTGQLGARLRRLVILLDPDAAKTRYDEALEDRRVTSSPNADGTANLHGLNLPAHRVGAATRRINRLAQAAKSADDPRTMDQIRADVLMDLLQGKKASQTRGALGTVDIQVDLTTLAGLAEEPGELRGFGPVIADIARQVTEEQPDSEWRYTITDDEGQVVHNGTTRRRPTVAQARQVEARNPTCVFPGCRMPASACDLDHNQAWSAGGPTDVENLAPLCRHDHVIRHRGWAIKQPRPGSFQWTSPLGHRYTVRPGPP
jgi:hypothetical protein